MDSWIPKHLTLTAVIDLLACLAEIVEICQNSQYPEDLEDIYDVLDKHIASWRDK